MSAASILFFVAAGIALYLGFKSQKPWLACVGGVLLTVGLGSIFTGFIVATKTAIDDSAAAVGDWASKAFTGAVAPNYTTLVIVVIGAIVLIIARGTGKGKVFLSVIGILMVLAATASVFPHLSQSTLDGLTALGKILSTWATKAFK